MGLEAMNGPLALVLDPAGITIVLTGRGNDGCIDQCPGLDQRRLDLSCMVTVSNSARSSLCATSSLRNRTKAVRSGVASFAENPQKRRKEARSSTASANFTSDRSYQIDRSNALNIASGGQAGSPLEAG